MQGYDGTEQFYSTDPYQNLQLIEYGRLHNQVNSTTDTGTTYVDQAGNKIVQIVGKDTNGNTVTKQYRLVDLTELIDIPKLQELIGIDGQELHLDKLTQESIGASMFHAQSYNLDEIEKAINILLKNQATQQSNDNDIVEFFKKLSNDQLSQLSISISKLIDERYYSKDDVDNKVRLLQRQINNINHYIGDKPQPNSNFAKGFTGNPDYNDSIMDSKVQSKVENLNIEDEEGDSNGK